MRQSPLRPGGGVLVIAQAALLVAVVFAVLTAAVAVVALWAARSSD